MFENEETVSFFSPRTQNFYFYIKKTNQIFYKKIDIPEGHSLQGLLVDKTQKNSILNTKMLVTFNKNKDQNTDLFFYKFDFTDSEIDCLFTNANKETPNCIYRVQTFKSRFDLTMDFEEFGSLEKELKISLGILVGITIILVIFCRIWCRKKKKSSQVAQVMDVSYGVSFGDYSKDIGRLSNGKIGASEFDIGYMNEAYDGDTSSGRRSVGDIYD